MKKDTWEEIIIKIRKDPNYRELVEKAYFDENLGLNVKRFSESEEFQVTLQLIKQYAGKSQSLSLLDIGAGNGISSVAFSRLGYRVTAIEPDESMTIGSGAINVLKAEYDLDNLTVISSFGESLPLSDESFDIVYIRQAMHHAANLPKFVLEAARALRKGGLLITIRDHVIYDQADKEWFLAEHPLHKFYGGENAFTELEYKGAMINAGLSIQQVIRHYDSVINYFPLSSNEYQTRLMTYERELRENLRSKIGPLSKIEPVFKLYKQISQSRNGMLFDEKTIAGRMYTFIARKAL